MSLYSIQFFTSDNLLLKIIKTELSGFEICQYLENISFRLKSSENYKQYINVSIISNY